MNPFVSIIVPVYNVQKHLIRCLDSLLNQAYSNFEILLINDGSTDSSGQICNDYQAKSDKIKVFHIENGGVSNARNYGIENSKGDFIQFVDSDDFVNEHYISSMINQIHGKSVDLVISGIKQVQFAGSEITLTKEIVSQNHGFYKKGDLKPIMSDLIDSSYINYCYSKLISRKVLIENNIRFNKNISLGEDTLFVLDVIKHSKYICILSRADYNYLIHSNDTLTYKFRPDKFYILNNLSKEISDFCMKEGYYTEDVKGRLDKRYIEMVRFCLDENFKRTDSCKFPDKLKNMRRILSNEDVRHFISKERAVFNNYPKSLINAIRSKNALRYFGTYYVLILSKKVRELL